MHWIKLKLALFVCVCVCCERVCFSYHFRIKWKFTVFIETTWTAFVPLLNVRKWPQYRIPLFDCPSPPPFFSASLRWSPFVLLPLSLLQSTKKNVAVFPHHFRFIESISICLCRVFDYAFASFLALLKLTHRNKNRLVSIYIICLELVFPCFGASLFNSDCHHFVNCASVGQ